jgi:DNA polymerase III subunit beta
MNITLNGSELLPALIGAAKAVPRKKSVPVLGCVRFSVENDQVKLTTTDLDGTAVYTFDESKIINRSGSVIIHLKDLQRLVKKAGKDSIRLSDVKTDQAEITLSGELGERTHFLPAYPENEWPEPVADLPVKDADGRFLETLRRVHPFASTDQTRAILNGVAIQAHQGQHLAVATDGHRLCVSEAISLPLERDVVLPPHRFLLWPQLSSDCAVGADERYLRVVSGNWSFTIKQIEGQFPNWRQVLHRYDNPKAFTIDPLDLPTLEEAVRTLPGEQSVIPENGDVLVFREEGGKLVLESTNVETGKHQRTLPKSTAESGIWIALKRGYVLDAVKAGFMSWRMEDALTPVQSTTEAGAVHVLMPMRTEEAKQKFPVTATAPEPVNPADPSESAEPSPPEIQPQTKEEQTPMTEETKPALTVMSANEDKAEEEDLLTMVQTARETCRTLNTALKDIAVKIRADQRANKVLHNELGNARSVLEKLKNIAA